MDAIYARQSIDKKGSLSIEGQIELCRKFTADDALVFSDKGFSGKKTPSGLLSASSWRRWRRQRAVRHFLTDGTGHAQHCDDLCPA